MAELLPGIWYAILALMFGVFAVTEGWNFGAGAVSLFVAREDAERRQVVEAIGPLWSWHEVWLVAAGGTLFVAFPSVLATALSGYYLAVFLLLWCLILRGIALEVGGHLAEPMWRRFWDVVFALSSGLLAVLFGAAFGNLLRGVPLDASGRMFMPLFTDFRPRGTVGILDWYTVAIAVFTLLLLAAHGATFLMARTDGPVRERSARFAGRTWKAVLVLLPVVSWLTIVVRDGFFEAMLARPLAWLAAVAVLAGLAAVFIGRRSGKDSLAFAGSSTLIAGLLAGAAVSLYPVFLHSTLGAQYSMTASGGASGTYGLSRALLWWPAALVLSVSYGVFVGRRYAGRVRPAAGAPQA